MSYQLITQDNWPRKDHFDFYRQFANPRYSLCTQVAAKSLKTFCQQQQIAFTDAYLYLCLQAINQQAEFRQRIAEQEIRQYQQVNMNAVKMAANNTFRFTYLPQTDAFVEFVAAKQIADNIATAKPFRDPSFTEQQANIDTVYVSILPWINFTSFSHAESGAPCNGIPRLVFGQYQEVSGNMPLAIEVNHALVDGWHVAQLLDKLQTLFNQPQQWLT